MKNHPIIRYIKKELYSFTHAFRGMAFLATDHNFYFHFPVGLGVLLAGWFFEIERFEWLWIISGVAAVWVTEALNTAIEKLTDLAQPAYHPLAGKVKDIAAAAVLLAVVYAGAVGLIVFWPYLWALWLEIFG